MKKLCLSLFITVSNILYAQELNIIGEILDPESIPLERASIVLSKNEDGTPVVSTAMSNKEGYFEINGLSAGNYILKIYFLGYLPQNITIELQDKDIDLGTIAMESATQNLGEIQITAERLKSFAGKDIFRLSDVDKRSSANALDAVKLLPKMLISTDDLLFTTRGEPVKILVNGINATATDLSLIPPDNIVRVDFYEIPPARYALMGFGAAIDVITKENIVGGQVAVNLQNAVNLPHGNDVVGLKYNFGNSAVNFRYRVRYQNYKQYVLDEQFNYQFNDLEFDKKKTGLDSPWDRLLQVFDLDFTNQKSDNYVFNAKFTLNTQNQKQSANQRIEQITPISEQYSAWNTEENKHIIPALDLYFNKKIDSTRDLSFNVVGTYSDATFFNQYVEAPATNDTSFFSETRIDGDRYSLISDAVYTKTFSHERISVGLRNMYSFSEQNVETTRLEHLTSNQNTLYGFVQLGGRRSKFSYSLSLGANHFTFNSRSLSQNYSYSYFKPVMDIGYDFNKKSSLRFIYQINTQNPSLSELSANTVMRDNYFAYSGNPELEPFKTHSTLFLYDYTMDNFTVYVDAAFDYSRNPIRPYFIEKSDYILQTLSNLKDAKRYSLALSAQWFPFESKWLRLRFWGEIFRNENSGTDFSWAHNDYRIIPSIIVQYKKWAGTIYYQSSNRVLNGQLLTGTESMAYAELNYKPIKGMTILLGFRYPFHNMFKYGVTSGIYGSDFIRRHSFQDWKDERNTVFLQFIYTFAFGKQQAEARRKLNNADTDSGIFRID